MAFLDRLQADLKQALTQHQHDLVIQLLHKRFAELTLDDIQALLKSPLGRGLGKVRVAELVSNVATAAPAAEKPQATSKAKVKARRQGKKRREGKKPAIRSSDEILNAVLTALAGDEPLNQVELATVARADRKTVRKMLAALMAAGRIQVTGTPARPRYSLIGRSDPIKATRGPTSKAAKNTKTKVNGRSVAGRERYDAAVLEALRASPEAGTSSTDLLAATGGTLPQLRLALGRLVAAGKVHREGERDQTRYTLSSSN